MGECASHAALSESGVSRQSRDLDGWIEGQDGRDQISVRGCDVVGKVGKQPAFAGHKENVSGGAPYGFRLPDGCADALFVAETTMPFVSYLNWVFRRGGFPASTGAPNEWRITSTLAKDLLPL